MATKMKTKFLLATFALVVVALVSLTASYGATSDVEPESRSDHKLPKLFDFEYYKQRFGKRYDSLLEALNRKRLFFARAFKAFVSGLNYKLGRQSYYNAVNDMSDESDEERAATLNQAIMLEASRRAAQLKQGGNVVDNHVIVAHDDDEFIPDEKEDYEEDLRQLIKQHGDKPGFKELKQELESGNRRVKEEFIARKFSFDKLIAGDANAEPSSEKLVREVASNNPNYERIELPSFGLRGATKVKLHKVKRKDSRPFIERAVEFIDTLLKPEMREIAVTKKPEEGVEVEWTVDLRRNGCFTPVKNQRRCGSCWAFATVAVMEWIYCNQTGQLVPFSEQYMVDCIPVSSSSIKGGCKGVLMPKPAVWFVNNFGLELESNYPYFGLEGECPYDDKTDVKTTGYIRSPIKHMADVHISRWEEVLPYGPILMGIAAPPGLRDYGGGVYDGRECGLIVNHEMLTLGHGRQDGEEFWLIRNSWGRFSGENGYIKLSKKYAKRCIQLRSGQALGTKDGINYEFNFEKSIYERPYKPWTMRKRVTIPETWLQRHNPFA